MKKGRPAHTVSALSRAELASSLRDVLFEQTSTIGIRQSTVHRFASPRMFVEVPVAGGPVAIKVAHRDGVIVRVTPEFEDVGGRGCGVVIGTQRGVAGVDRGSMAGWPSPWRTIPAR